MERNNRKKWEKKVYRICSCNKILYAKSTYFDHKKICDVERNVRSKNIEQNDRKVYRICSCKEIFYTKFKYFYHKKKCHAEQNVTSKNDAQYYICQEKGCSCKFRCAKNFKEHLKTHGLEMKEEVKIFKNYLEFETWKEEYEKQTISKFTLKAHNKYPTGEKKHFFCNRSGQYQTLLKRKRSLKCQGSSKIGFNCTAAIVVELTSDKVIAKICHTHYGHKNELAHTRISKYDRNIIATQLMLGVEDARIIQNMYSKKSTQLERQNLCTKQDIFNISQAYGIKKSKKHSEDNLSVDASMQDQTMMDISEEVIVDETNNDVLNNNVEIGQNYILSQISQSDDIKMLQDSLLSMGREISKEAQNCYDKDLLISARQHTKNALNMLKLNLAENKEFFNSMAKIPHKNVEKQNFYSTKKSEKGKMYIIQSRLLQNAKIYKINL